MLITLRIPPRAQYSYAEVSISPKDKADALAQLSEIDEELAAAIGATVDQAVAIANIKAQLPATVVASENRPKKPWERDSQPTQAAAIKPVVPSATDFFS